MNYACQEIIPASVLHWNYRGFTEFPMQKLEGEEIEITDIYLKENLIARLPREIGKFVNLESLYLSGNDITELPEEISQLRCLKCLDLSGNRLQCIPDEIGDIRGLKFLMLDENELCELPLRLSELKQLRYLSVCDNKLKWLPQRPVYNYHHCEFRFWRNTDLNCIPYSLWYHMFRDQQTRSLNIGCLRIPQYEHRMLRSKCRIKLKEATREWDYDVNLPNIENIISTASPSPPSLFELCKRNLYVIISDIAKIKTNLLENVCFSSLYNDFINCNYDNVNNLNENFVDFNLNNNIDINGNNTKFEFINEPKRPFKNDRKYYTPKDVIDENFAWLPYFIKKEFCIGPASKCENIDCKRPIFDFVVYEFSIGKIILIDSSEDVILSCAFCSKKCAEIWKHNRDDVLSWECL